MQVHVETTQYDNNNDNDNDNNCNNNNNDNNDNHNDDDDDDKLITFLKGINPEALIALSFVLFSDQRQRSFWSARRIVTSGQVQQGKSSTHGLPIQFGQILPAENMKRISVHDQKVGSGQRLRFLVWSLDQKNCGLLGRECPCFRVMTRFYKMGLLLVTS